MLGHRINKVLTVTLILLALPAMAGAADVLDQGHFFSASAIEKANHSIREIEKRSGQEIRIETYATVPAGKVDAVAKMDKKEREKFTHEWVDERAEATKAKGFFLLVCKDPPRVETWVSKHLKNAGFTTTDRDHAKEAALTAFHLEDYDGALHDVVAKLSTSYARLGTHHTRSEAPIVNHPVMPVRHAQSSWMPVVYILGIVLIGIFVISMISRMFGGGARGYGGGYGGGGMGQPGYGGGGGFMSSLAGGIFGSMAGNWLYDSFSGRSAHAHDSTLSSGDQAIADDRSSQNDGGWSNDNDSNSGGWFGGDSSGGGGGDFGGGDAGGGDYGGGGDF